MKEIAKPLIYIAILIAVSVSAYIQGTEVTKQEFCQYIEPVRKGEERLEDGAWQIDYGKPTAVLAKAIIEQQAIIEELKARIKALETPGI